EVPRGEHGDARLRRPQRRVDANQFPVHVLSRPPAGSAV
ncbi:MAG: hypothetical protein AVDCRST_MAG77-4244, partial [uncultured Chloroflexi bacterium]